MRKRLVYLAFAMTLMIMANGCIFGHYTTKSIQTNDNVVVEVWDSEMKMYPSNPTTPNNGSRK
jgi:hypothetical protein